MIGGRGNLFGTDGARGIANADLTAEIALAVGRAFGAWLRQQEEQPRVLVARDTRLSGPMLSAALAAGLCTAGVQVADCGVLPTPGLHLLARAEDCSGGVVVSASHNPPDFNGLKLLARAGQKLTPREEREIEALVFAEEDLAPRPTGAEVGAIELRPTAAREYVERLLEGLGQLDLGGLKVALDCAYGAAYEAGPAAFRQAGAEVIAIHAEAEGARINVEAGALHPERLAAAVLTHGASLGIAFDGDADRAIIVDDKGQVRNGDHIKYLLAVDLQDRGKLDPPLVVGTVMSNLGLELALEARGIRLLRTRVGDRAVREAMEDSGAVLGGEQAGHIIFAETGVGDGIYTGLRVCEVLARTGQKMGERCSEVPQVPQVLLNVAVRDKYAWERSEELKAAVREWETRLGAQGRVLIRASGTEPLVRVMVEAVEEGEAYAAAEALAEIVARELGYGEVAEE